MKNLLKSKTKQNQIRIEFDNFMWKQLNRELINHYKINPDEWKWVGNSQEGHGCPIALIENASGELINQKKCYRYGAWFDWDCKETCKKHLPKDFNMINENPYQYYQPEPDVSGVVVYWDLLDPDKKENCTHDFKNLPQKKDMAKPARLKN